MKFNTLTSLSPIDGRYFEKTSELKEIFSEFGLIKYRVLVEVRWLQTMSANSQISEVVEFDAATSKILDAIVEDFSLEDAQAVKKIECTTNHDVKACLL